MRATESIGYDDAALLLWFTPTATGEWDIACSQLCGLGHFRMRGVYASQTQAEFDAWLATEASLIPAS